MNYGANDEPFISADIMSYFLGSSADATMGPNDFVHAMDDAPNYFVGDGLNSDHSVEDARQT